MTKIITLPFRGTNWSLDVGLRPGFRKALHSGRNQAFRRFLGNSHRQVDVDGRTLPQPTGDSQPTTVALHDMLDDGKAQPGSALGSAPARIDAVESFGDARNVLGRNALAFVADTQVHHGALRHGFQVDRPALAAVADRI